MLAPVAAEIDQNLQRLRRQTAGDVRYELELELDRNALIRDRGGRVEAVLDQALYDVNTHGWTASITDDGCRLHLAGGSVSLDLGLSDGIIEYIREGVGA